MKLSLVDCCLSVFFRICCMSPIFITGKLHVSSLEFFCQFSHVIMLKVNTCRELWADLLSSSFANHLTTVSQFTFCYFKSTLFTNTGMLYSPIFVFVLRDFTISTQKMKFSIKDFFSKCDQSAVFCRFGHIYWRNTQWKNSFFVQCNRLEHY